MYTCLCVYIGEENKRKRTGRRRCGQVAITKRHGTINNASARRSPGVSERTSVDGTFESAAAKINVRAKREAERPGEKIGKNKRRLRCSVHARAYPYDKICGISFTYILVSLSRLSRRRTEWASEEGGRGGCSAEGRTTRCLRRTAVIRPFFLPPPDTCYTVQYYICIHA